MGRADYLEEPFEIEIKHGVAIHKWPDGKRTAVPLAVFRVQLARANRALAEFDASKRIVPIKKERDHAASP